MAIKNINSSKLILSRHLYTVQYNNNQQAILNRNNGISLLATADFLAFLDQFQRPLSIEDAENEFAIDDLENKIHYLIDKKFISDKDYDEEIEYLEQNLLAVEKNRKCTENFIIYYPKDVIYPIPFLCNLLEKVYSYILKRGLKKLTRKSIVFICENIKEFEFLWGIEKIPSNVKFFVSHGRIITIKPDQIYSFAIDDEIIFKVMVHEVIHIFLYENYTNIPIWCTEGLCEYYSNNSYSITLDELIGSKRLYRFSELTKIAKHSILDIDISKIESNIGYRQSVSFITFLANLFGEDRLMECVMGTGLSKNFEKKFKETFMSSLEHYELEWRKILGFI